MRLRAIAASVPGARLVAARLRHSRQQAVVPDAGFPPGHFHSPIPSIADIREREDDIFGLPAVLPGIDLREREQLKLIELFSDLYHDQPFERSPRELRRYYFDNESFGYGDALVLHFMLRSYRPQRLVEVGSGFSSAVVLDTNDLFLGAALRCTFIEPFPDRLYSLLRDDDRRRYRVLDRPVQDVSLDTFDLLESGDILFIDSTHVSKIGSDVNWLLFNVLPRLRPGVLVHFHDVFYPFEYPREWIYEGRAWNEAYLVRAFLLFNPSFEILLFNSYLAEFHHDEVARRMPLWAMNTGGSLWLRCCEAT
jgi:hypothetical protein